MVKNWTGQQPIRAREFSGLRTEIIEEYNNRHSAAENRETWSEIGRADGLAGWLSDD